MYAGLLIKHEQSFVSANITKIMEIKTRNMTKVEKKSLGNRPDAISRREALPNELKLFPLTDLTAL